MRVETRLKVPTGHILIVSGDCGQLEMLSLGDYGKDVNVKCDAIGLGRPLGKVEHTQMLPLEEKWVITISTQYGCAMGCTFCDVPKVGSGRNATHSDMTDQILTGMRLHPEVTHSNRLNIHFARMGEPTWNPWVLDVARWLKVAINPTHRVHPVVSTMMPKRNAWLRAFLRDWIWIKNDLFQGEAGLQLSINSTDEQERFAMFGGSACNLDEISWLMEGMEPLGRKITLNFAVADYTISPDTLLRYFDPEHYIVKLTPMHKTTAAVANFTATPGDYTTYHPYAEHEEKLKAAGYDVLVFIASEEEDLGRITCGNAILSGSSPEAKKAKVE